MDLPDGFIDLAAAYKSPDDSFVNIIGATVDLMEPRLSRGSSFMLLFKLLDERLSRSVEGSQGLGCTFFRNDIEGLPKIRRVGDIVLLRNMKVSTVHGTKRMLSNFQTETTVISVEAIPSKAFSITYKTDKGLIPRLGIPQHIDKFNLAEQDYVIHLNEAMKVFVDLAGHKIGNGNRQLEQEPEGAPLSKKQKVATTPMMSTASRNPKLKLIKDLRGHEISWADIYAVVVKRIGVTYGCDMYVTDYTENEAVRRYPYPEEETDSVRDGDVYGYNGPKKKEWKGPWGHTILKVNLKPPHAQYVNTQVNEDDVVLLKNVKMRIAPEGAWLEGDMWPDDRYPDKIQVQKVKNLSAPEVQDIMKRKDKYWSKRDNKLAQKAAPEGRLSKTERKKQKKQAKKAAKAATVAGNERQVSDAGSTDSTPRRRKKSSKTNPAVQCAHEENELTSIKDILDVSNARHINEGPNGTSYILPFTNARYRATVRVVDYEPKSLEDFAFQPEPEYASSPHREDWALQSSTWEWYFSLLLEDAASPGDGEKGSHRLWVQVHHDAAQWLLGNNFEDPDNLKHNPKLLAKLREQLFILWGNLEEKGADEKLSNTSFECCIQEYGIELGEDELGRDAPKGWRRMHAMFGVTIRD